MLEKFENKVLEIKEKMNPRFAGVFAFCIFGLTMLYGMQMANMFKREKQKTQDSYNRSMYELVSYSKNVDSLLTKARVTTTPVESSKIYADIWRQSNLAKENLSILPVNQHGMGNASKFLTQTSDYAYTILKQTVSGNKLTDAQYKELEELNKSSTELAKLLNNVYEDLNVGRLKWDEVEKEANKELEKSEEQGEGSNISKLGEPFKNYAGLIYDGAFSDHIESIKPKMLTGKQVSVEDAKKKIEKMLEVNKEKEIENIEKKGDSKGKLDVYIFEVKYRDLEEKLNIEITKDTGLVSLMVGDRHVKDKNIDEKEAIKKGIEFLNNMGIEDIKDTYYTIQENMITINYAAVQDEIILYPDLLKVKVAMDNGEVCSLETLGYIYNHTQRTDIYPELTIEEARDVLNKNIEVEDSRLVIIPTESKSEVLTYEFKGKINEKDFLIYINAKTGIEEQILIVLDTENGILTM